MPSPTCALPDGDGLELVRHIAENVRDLPVAVITAFGSMDNAVTALKAGAFDYLSSRSLDRAAAGAGEVGVLGERRGHAEGARKDSTEPDRRLAGDGAGALPSSKLARSQGAGLHLGRIGQRQRSVRRG